ncbi:MAG: carotenoid 1,2-hydratase [Burkholderiales bacterium]|nr:carotenoid 1,2-hydratase [Burkholderiales bacterium]
MSLSGLASLAEAAGARAAPAAAAAAAPASTASASTPPPSPSPSTHEGVRRGRPLQFPRDHGAHLGTRTEWWYLTGWLAPEQAADSAPTHGFQVTFFRSQVAATDRADAAAARGGPGLPGRFAPRHLLFAHAAVTDLAAGRHQHAQRLARWNGDPATGPDRALTTDADVRLARWHLARETSSPWQAARWRAGLRSDAFSLQGTLLAVQPPLLQGDAGFSRKGPEERQASHYYSVPQLQAQLTLEVRGQRQQLHGRAWLDHEWSDELLHPHAVGWDWIGMNLLDGSALTAFRLRRADGSTLWAGGSHRHAAPGAAPRAFEPGEVAFEPGSRWRSAATSAMYPVRWQVRTPAGRHTVRALLDAQELDGRTGTGTVYWEGVAELLDEGGRRVGLGYLEMTGYAAPVKLG